MRGSSLPSGLSAPGPHRRSRTGAWWGVLVVVSALLVLLSPTDPARALQEAAARLLGPVQNVASGIAGAIEDVAATVAEIDRLRSENDRLRSDLAGAEQRIAELQEATRQNDRLRELLRLQSNLGWDLEPAQVVAAGTDALTWDVAIGVGRDDGLRVGMPVVGLAPGGGALVGLVIEASPDRSVVRLLVDPRSRAVARDQETGSLGLVQGQPGGQLVMTQIPLTDAVAVGDTIATAGLELEGVAASAYPAGLLIGTVSAVEPDPNGLTQTAFVRPAVDPRTIEWVMVVRSASEE